MSETPEVTPEAIKRLSRDLRNAAKLMGVKEARYFVDTYYQIQDFRIASANQQRKLLEGEEPSEFMAWLNTNLEVLETQIKAVLDKWSAAQPMGEWARAVVGIGPVISAGLMANIDIKKAPTVGHIWRFAGLDPTSQWKRKEKRPWNASLKRLCWLMGESFVKVSGNKNDRYGKLYLQRKAYESKKNENCDYRAICEKRIEEDQKKPASKRMDADLVKLLETGKLPAKSLHERSKRWAVKLFLAHWHAEAYWQHYGEKAPKPYPLSHLGHVHEIKP